MTLCDPYAFEIMVLPQMEPLSNLPAFVLNIFYL